MVPGGGFEPPTRGFSIPCSTPELPGHGVTTASRERADTARAADLILSVAVVQQVVGGRPWQRIAVAEPLQQVAVAAAWRTKR